jgi:CPA2 family monovalent cation:H+ antiporter-2
VINGIFLLLLIWLSLNFLVPYLNETIEDTTVRGVVAMAISLGLGLPFLWALMAKKPDGSAYKELWLEKKYNRGPLLLLEAGRVLLGIVLIGVWASQLFSNQLAILIAVPIIMLILFVFTKRMKKFYRKIESRFLTNLNARETASANLLSSQMLVKNAAFQTRLAPWDAHIVQLEARPNALYIGKPLKELQWREQFGINVVYIKRGENLIQVPDRSQYILPFDQVGIVATDAQMVQFKPVFDQTDVKDSNGEDVDMNEIVFDQLVVNEYTKLKGLSIRDSGLRERTNGIVIGIERNNERLLNPDSTTVFDWGDIIWIVGERQKIQSFNNASGRAK